MKHIVSILLAFALFVTPITFVHASDNGTETIMREEKEYCNATLDDDFADDCVI